MRAVIVATIALVVLVIHGAPMFMHPPTLYSGVSRHSTGALVQPNIIDVAPNSPAYRAGLRSGDVIGCLSLRDSRLLFFTRAGYVPGTPLSLCVNRNGVRRQVRFVPEARPPAPSLYINDTLAGVRLAAYAVLLLCSVILVLGRPGLMTWCFFVFAIVSAPNTPGRLYYTVDGPWFYLFWFGCSNLLTPTFAAWLLAFTLLVPDDSVRSGWRASALRATLAVVPVMSALGILTYGQSAFYFSERIIAAAYLVLVGLVILTVLCRVVKSEPAERARFAWAALAITWTVVLFLLTTNAITGVSGAPIAMLEVITPLLLMYVIFKRHVIDIRFAVSRTLVYAIITTFVVAIVGAVDWATSAYLHEVKVAMALDALATIAVAFALNRLHRWVERAVDMALFRRKYAAEEYLDRLGPTLLDARREETIHGELAGAPVRALDLTMAAVFRSTDSAFVLSASAGSKVAVPPAFDPDHELVRFLNTGRALVHLSSIVYESAAALAIPIFQGKRLTGFVLYGPHTDGTHLDPDEIDTLKRFCDAAAQAYISITYERYNALPQAALA